MTHRYEELASQLDSISEQLSELAFEALREAAERGEDKNPEIGKRLTRAMRATEKAAALLREV